MWWVLLIVQLQISNPVDQNQQEQMEQKSLSQLAEIVESLEHHSLHEDQTLENLASAAINGLLQRLDPHSSYLNRETFMDMMASQSRSFSGIGIKILQDGSHLFITEIKKGSPADKAGLAFGDEILQINGVSINRGNMVTCIKKIRGENQQPVALQIRKYATGDGLSINLIREEISNTNISFYSLIPPHREGQITGYIKLDDFGETSGQELGQALKNLSQKEMNFLILDLRGNPGGLLPQAIEVAGLFLPPQTKVVSTQNRNSHETRLYYTRKEDPLWTGPMVVLMDSGTASAAEIVAGALQDHDRAILVGTQSWGKGLVQSIFPIPPGETGMAITTARYYTPLGRNIQGEFTGRFEYFQPDSGETFFFDEKTENDPFVLTETGRKIYYSRGICPDIFMLDKVKINIRKAMAHNQTLLLFLLKNPHLEPYPVRSFYEDFSECFTENNNMPFPVANHAASINALYLEYLNFFDRLIRKQPKSVESVKREKLIAICPQLFEQASFMARSCFFKEPLPQKMIASFTDLSLGFREGKEDFR